MARLFQILDCDSPEFAEQPLQPVMICRQDPLAHKSWFSTAAQVRIEGDLLFPDVRPERARQVWVAYSTHDMMIPSGLARPELPKPMINLDRLVILAKDLNDAVLRGASIQERDELYWAVQSERFAHVLDEDESWLRQQQRHRAVLTEATMPIVLRPALPLDHGTRAIDVQYHWHNGTYQRVLDSITVRANALFPESLRDLSRYDLNVNLSSPPSSDSLPSTNASSGFRGCMSHQPALVRYLSYRGSAHDGSQMQDQLVSTLLELSLAPGQSTWDRTVTWARIEQFPRCENVRYRDSVAGQASKDLRSDLNWNPTRTPEPQEAIQVDLVTDKHGMQRVRGVRVDANLLFPEAQHDLWREHLDEDTLHRAALFEYGVGDNDSDEEEALWSQEYLSDQARSVLDLAANPGTTIEDRAKTLVALRWDKRENQGTYMSDPNEYPESEEEKEQMRQEDLRWWDQTVQDLVRNVLRPVAPGFSSGPHRPVQDQSM